MPPRDFAPYRPDDERGPAPGLVLRAAAPSEAGAVVAFEARVRGTGMQMDSLVAAVDDPERAVLVAEVGGALVGWAKTHHWGWADGPAAAGHYLGGVTVDPAWRRRGIADALTRERLRWIAERATEAWYVVNAANPASIALHEAYGFQEVARAARFHTISFTGGEGILFRAGPLEPRPTPTDPGTLAPGSVAP